jgi:general secretion pathway protein A
MPASALTVSNFATEDLDELLAQLPGDITTAWRELAPAWKLPATTADPCQSARTQFLQCYRSAQLSMPLLRQLARPGILTLQSGKNAPAYAVLTGLSDQTATLQIAGQTHQIKLIALAKLWRGDFATFWQAPPGYQPDLRDGSTGPAVDWLAARLDQLDGATSKPTGAAKLDKVLREKVRAFQVARGITAEGRPGPMTFMQLESALGLQSPKLTTLPTAAP